MDLTPVAEALILGLVVNLACVGVCLPILVPLILERDRGWRRGLATAGLFSLGRLVVYMGLGLSLLALGQTLADEPDAAFLRGTAVVAGLALLAYGGWVAFGKSGGSGCCEAHGAGDVADGEDAGKKDDARREDATEDDARPMDAEVKEPPMFTSCWALAGSFREHAATGRGVTAIFLGALVGSLLCPPLWVALAGAVLTFDLLILVLSVLAFWAGSSVSILAVGLAWGHLAPFCEAQAGGRRGIRDAAAVILVIMGLFYLSKGLMG